MKLRLALAASAAGLLAASAAGAAPATATATATATIVTPGSVARTRDLDFGTIARPTAGTTTVTVASAATDTATPSVSGGNGFVPTPGLARAATFHLVGTAGSSYTFDPPTLSFTSATGNLGSIGAEAPTAQAGTTLLTLPAGTGAQDLYVGGHFDITSSTTPATYTGTLTLTINFP